MKRLKIALVFPMLACCASLCSCQAAPVAQAQSARQDSGAPQTSPVSQRDVFIYAPTIIAGTNNDPNAHHVDASGDLRSAESLRTGTQAGGAQTSSPTQDNSGLADAAVKAAETFLSTVDPTSAAGALAKKAVAAAKAKAPDAAALLDEAKKADVKPGTAPPQ